MAEENAESGSKTEAPTQRRLEEARTNGDIPKSADVASLASLLGASLVILFNGPAACAEMATRLAPFLAQAGAMDVSPGGLETIGRSAAEAALPGLWVLLAAIAAAIAANFLQQGFVWAPSKLAPDFSRLSPAEGFKRVFGLDGLMHFLRSLMKLIAVGAVTWMVLRPKATLFQNLSAINVAAVLPLSQELLRAVIIAVLIALGVIAMFDFFWQRQRFMDRLKMTKEQVKEDTKQAEGDPHVRAKIRQLRMKRGRARMIQSVPKATLVLMNPTHYAVALRYVQGETAAPICVAKGVDALALKIRDVAREHEIPVVEDPPLARALYAAMDVDETIPREHYQAVAKVIGFVMGRATRRPSQSARAGGGRL